jgi:DNA-directed RNA polymerase subunit RPC12/RpoP
MAYKNYEKNSKILAEKGVDWKITILDGTQTVEVNMADELGKSKKSHVCLFCGKIYNRKYGLKIHLRTHTGYKPLKCKVCLRPFSDPSNLNKHVRLHSQGDTPYRCPYCSKILVRKRDLDRHIMSRHTQNNGDALNHDLPDEDDDEEIDICK